MIAGQHLRTFLSVVVAVQNNKGTFDSNLGN